MQVILTSFRIIVELLILVGIGMLLKQKNIVSAQTVKRNEQTGNADIHSA